MEEHITKFKEAIREVLSQLDPEAAQLFLDRFTEKLNEQKRIKKDSGTPR
jgi:trans-aconitate methyltransferase